MIERQRCYLFFCSEQHTAQTNQKINKIYSQFNSPAVSVLRRAVVEVKQRCSVFGWVTKNLLSRAPPCFGRHVKLLVPAAFAVVNTHQPALGPRGVSDGPFSLCVIHNEGLYLSSGDINRLMIIQSAYLTMNFRHLPLLFQGH
jgi:hypothetical protein